MNGVTEKIARALSTLSEFSAGDTIAATTKSIIIDGMWKRQKAVIKILTADDEDCVRWFNNEMHFYMAVASRVANVATAEMLAFSPLTSCVVLSRIEGSILRTGRLFYEDGRLLVDSIVNTLSKNLLPSNEGIEVCETLREGVLNKCLSLEYANYLPNGATEIAATLAPKAQFRSAYAHGDPTPSNIMVTTDGGIALIDWEHCGIKPWLFDLAVMWVLSIHGPRYKKSIIRTLSSFSSLATRAFLLNLIHLYGREIRNYQIAKLPSSQKLVAQFRRDIELIITSLKNDDAGLGILEKIENQYP